MLSIISPILICITKGRIKDLVIHSVDCYNKFVIALADISQMIFRKTINTDLFSAK